MLKICTLTADDETCWDDYINKSPVSTPYHLSGWKRIVEKTFCHKPYYILAKDKGKIVGVLPCFLIRHLASSGCSLISLPFT
ncbi:MAG: peptidoglycan bridge formation protein FemAB, partial [Candidatus Desantisbacteria bacterium]